MKAGLKFGEYLLAHEREGCATLAEPSAHTPAWILSVWTVPDREFDPKLGCHVQTRRPRRLDEPSVGFHTTWIAPLFRISHHTRGITVWGPGFWRGEATLGAMPDVERAIEQACRDLGAKRAVLRLESIGGDQFLFDTANLIGAISSDATGIPVAA